MMIDETDFKCWQDRWLPPTIVDPALYAYGFHTFLPPRIRGFGEIYSSTLFFHLLAIFFIPLPSPRDCGLRDQLQLFGFVVRPLNLNQQIYLVF